MTATHLGIIDWGVGGLGLLGLLDEAQLPVPVTYWSDTGSAPYGLQRPSALADRLRWVVAQLAERGCTEVVLACNAASTAVDRLTGAAVPVEGIIAPGIAATEAALSAVRAARAGLTGLTGLTGPTGLTIGVDRVEPLAGVVVGVVGGQGTIRSGRYRRGLSAPDRQVLSRVAQPLSAHIEGGRIGTEPFVADLRRIVAPLRGADAVVLACTHYPAAASWFAAELPDTVLVDPAAALAESLVARFAVSSPPPRPGPQLQPQPQPGLRAPSTSLPGAPPPRTFVTTGDPAAMRSAAGAAWSRTLPDITPVAP